MRIRGERECRGCGTRWSYYETGSIECPGCGSIASRGLDEQRVLHTEGAATLSLSAVRADVDERPLHDLATAAKRVCREYVRQDGFLRGGDLRPLDDIHLAARELIHVADIVDRSFDAGDDEERYLLELLRVTDQGERPAADEVPATLRSARGLAIAEGVGQYRRELRDWLVDHPHPAVDRPLDRLEQHAKRLRALQGDVDPASAEQLVAATRELVAYVRDDDADALVAARDRLDRLAASQED